MQTLSVPFYSLVRNFLLQNVAKCQSLFSTVTKYFGLARWRYYWKNYELQQIHVHNLKDSIFKHDIHECQLCSLSVEVLRNTFNVQVWSLLLQFEHRNYEF